MTEELKVLYKRLLESVDSEGEDIAALKEILEYEISLFDMHFGMGNCLRRLIVCGLCSGIAARVLEKADADDRDVIEGVKEAVMEMTEVIEEVSHG